MGAAPPVTPLPRERVLAWLARRKLSQNALADAIGREASSVSKVIRGQIQSAPIWKEIRAYMRSPGTYKPASIRSRRQREAVARARKVLRRSGFLA